LLKNLYPLSLLFSEISTDKSKNDIQTDVDGIGAIFTHLPSVKGYENSMLQMDLELVWSFWQLVGLVLTIPIAFYWFKRSLKKWDFREAIEDDTIPIRIVAGFAIFVLPLIVGETLAVIACLLTYPEESESTLYRGLRYYVVVLGGLLLMLSLFRLSNRRRKKEQENLMHQVDE